MDLTQTLREAIEPLHRRIEALPYNQALLQGCISRVVYVRGLQQLYHLHRSIEERLAGCPELRPLYRPDMARTALIRRDLDVVSGLEPDAPTAEIARLVRSLQ